MTHTFHPYVWDPDTNPSETAPVLSDDCPRCGEHTRQPRATLDPRRVARLEQIRGAGGPYNSQADRVAVVNLDPDMPLAT